MPTKEQIKDICPACGQKLDPSKMPLEHMPLDNEQKGMPLGDMPAYEFMFGVKAKPKARRETPKLMPGVQGG